MKNILKASIHFSFKGKEHSPSMTVELEPYLEGSGTFPNLCSLIAKANNHDPYSYEYEMMQATEIKYSDAQGLVAEFINADGQLDVVAFEAAWTENKALIQLLAVAKEHMQITDFSEHVELKKALLEAYMLGKKDEALNSSTSQAITESF